jgi:hypothetical protein
MMKVLHWVAIPLAALACAGCIGLPDGQTSAFGGAYPIVVSEMYDPSQPDGLLIFERDSGGAPVRGKVLGKIHGWPFPHVDPNGDFGENLFTYEIEFVVTQRTAGNPAQPAIARGTRRVYFHPDRAPAQLGDPASFSEGQPVIVDSVDLSFNFGPGPGEVQVTSSGRQTSTVPFDYDGQQVTPPNRPEVTASLSGTYSQDYGGYIFR